MKKYKALVLLLGCIYALTACGNLTNSKKADDRIEVYDGNQNMIVEMVNQEDLDYFSELVGNTTLKMEDEDLPFVKLPKDAVVIYEYKFITKLEDGRETEMSFYVYENYPYITLEGVPIISPLTWKISDEKYEKLTHPEK